MRLYHSTHSSASALNPLTKPKQERGDTRSCATLSTDSSRYLARTFTLLGFAKNKSHKVLDYNDTEIHSTYLF